MRHVFVLVLACLLAGLGRAHASSPTPMDLALQMRVTADHGSTALTPGTRGLIEFTVENRWTRNLAVYISSAGTLVAAGATQPIRLIERTDLTDACPLQTNTPYDQPGTLFWYIRGPNFVAAGEAYRCRVGFEILPAAQGRRSLTFKTGVAPGLSILYFDQTPWNNLAHLGFGSAMPVPTGSTATWLLLALLMIVVTVNRQRRSSPR